MAVIIVFQMGILVEKYKENQLLSQYFSEKNGIVAQISESGCSMCFFIVSRNCAASAPFAIR